MSEKFQYLEKMKQLLEEHEKQMVQIRKRMAKIRSGKIQKSGLKVRIRKS